MKTLHTLVPMLCLAGCTADPTSGSTRDDPTIAGRRSPLATISDRIQQAPARKTKSVDEPQVAAATEVQTQPATTDTDLAAEQKDHAEAEGRAKDALEKLAIAGVAEEQEPRGLVIKLPLGGLFASGRSELLASAQRNLDQIATAIVEQPDHTIAVEVQTDSQGKDGMNQVLSKRRADSVLVYLISRRVPANRITTQGFGSNHLPVGNTNVGGQTNNRRIRTIIKSTEVTSR